MAQALPPHPLAAPPIALTMATGGASRSDAAPADSAAAASASAQGQGQRPPQSGTDGSAAMADHPEALDALLKALDDPSAQVREKAALAVGFWPDASAGEALIRALTDPDAQVREKAAIGLAMRRRPGAVGPLIAVLRDSDPQVREKAAIALGTTGSREAWTALANAMNDPDPQVREKVAAALILLKTDSAGIAENETLSAAVRLGLRLLEGLVK
jgi:HEAT repeat protein